MCTSKRLGSAWWGRRSGFVVCPSQATQNDGLRHHSAHLILAGLLVATAALAQPDYLPMQTGNQWIYRSSAGSVMTLEVKQSAEFGGLLYWLLQGLPDGDHWLRRDENGSVFAYDPASRQEQLWYAFLTPVGQRYQTFLPGSYGSPAVINSTKAIYWGPIGWFNWALEIQYPGVYQVGIYRELFLPYVGLVHREQGGGGPSLITWDLVYARLGRVTYVSEPEVSFGLTLDRSVYPASADMLVRMTLRNTNWTPLQIQFPTSQTFDFVVRDAKGAVVYRWSDGKAFLTVLHAETFGFGEKNYAILVPLAATAGGPLPPGKYVAEAWLATTAPQSYRASAGFEISLLP